VTRCHRFPVTSFQARSAIRYTPSRMRPRWPLTPCGGGRTSQIGMPDRDDGIYALSLSA
jgi:hypothetical protein